MSCFSLGFEDNDKEMVELLIPRNSSTLQAFVRPNGRPFMKMIYTQYLFSNSILNNPSGVPLVQSPCKVVPY
jgi:hypothetical protein